MQLEPASGQPGRDGAPDCLGLAAAVHYHVIAVALERDGRVGPGHPRVERVMHEEVREQRRQRRALWSSHRPPGYGAIRPVQRCFQPPLHIQNPWLAGMVLYRPENKIPWDSVEERPDIHIDY